MLLVNISLADSLCKEMHVERGGIVVGWGWGDVWERLRKSERFLMKYEGILWTKRFAGQEGPPVRSAGTSGVH